ncbi:MAG: hypothetical protein K2M13_00445 [Muribaculaceae bacterium]|nr:hypothetical protein [Muribaculaceae bacterium]
MGAAQEVAFKTDNEIFKYLDSVSSVAALDPRERDYYEAALKYSRDYNAILSTAKEKAEAQGREEGLAKGLAQGLAEGRAEGLAEGRAEGLMAGKKEEQRRIALEMLRQGISVDLVTHVTNLSIEEVQDLSKQ